ncbi:type III pantothenate kinase [Persephonella hydrogeniphila]|uniref:Type III pantothenate kinase n=1 Tax=Persephonella hydrogeniphila TaxID=198703 RepID=A0A285NEG8_9AQUI|nr:type III pantothenate kinase [Persephonella hydrogeniphila]SNZ07904.1 type III pantothenate kinase [Persephonella hydrogeniphila]
MIVGIDIGNTTIEIGFLQSKTLIKSYKLRTDRAKTVDDWYLNIHQIVQIEGDIYIEDFVISSVVPVVDEKVCSAVEKISGKKPLIIGKDLNIPIPNMYKNPEEVGTDRLVNAFGVVKKYGYPAVAVDFGTAITFDVINERGEYTGGAIFPGIDASVESLFTKTAKLPSVNLKNVSGVIGRTTVDSILSGIYFGYISLVEGMIEKINRQAGYKHKVVITGGNGELISKGLEIDFVYDRFLTMESIYMIYTENR